MTLFVILMDNIIKYIRSKIHKVRLEEYKVKEVHQKVHSLMISLCALRRRAIYKEIFELSEKELRKPNLKIDT